MAVLLVAVEILVIGLVLYGVVRLVQKVLADRHELKMLRERHAQKLESMDKAEDIVNHLMLDEELGKKVHRGLSEKLDRDEVRRLRD